MIEKKSDKAKADQKPRDDGIELENQFILRIPDEAAMLLHEILITPNSNLKDRMSIKLDADLRYGEVRLDQWLLYGKMVDLPTIIECQKTIDSKSFYKSADICQMMICKLEPHDLDKEESPGKGKKKDNAKVDKKFLWAHGITPPCKNIRKRRFRKTLKKKNVEAPEIEKEVKRLLRIDNDAVKVDFEIINEEVDKQYTDGNQSKDDHSGELCDDSRDQSLIENDGKRLANVDSGQKQAQLPSDLEEDDGAHLSMAPIENVGEHDIFGEEVSSSSDEDNTANSNRINDLDDTSRLSADDSRMTTFSAVGGNETNQSRSILEESAAKDDDQVEDFSKKLFTNSKPFYKDDNFHLPKDGFLSRETSLGTTTTTSQQMSYNSTEEHENQRVNLHSNNDSRFISEDDASNEVSGFQISQKVVDLRARLRNAKALYAQKSQEISSIQNPTLRHRMQETLDNLASEIVEQELEIKDYEGINEL